MGSVTTSPRFLSLALRLQRNMEASRHRGDSEFIAGTFNALDMLDMLDAELNQAPTPTNPKGDTV